LISQLKGTAALWLEGLGEQWLPWDYTQLVTKLRENFEIARTTHAEQLQSLKMNHQDLGKFNRDF
jgi:hypothetical protein